MQDKQNSELVIKNEKRYSLIIFLIVVMLILIYIYESKRAEMPTWDYNLNGLIIIMAVFFFTLYFLFKIFWQLFGETRFSVLDNNLMVINRLFFFKRRQATLNTKQISNIKIAPINSSSYWGIQGLRFHDKTLALQIKYKSEQVILAQGMTPCDLDELKNWLIEIVR